MLRMVEDAEKLDKLTKVIDVVGTKVEFGGDVEIDGAIGEHAISIEAKELMQEEYEKTLNLWNVSQNISKSSYSQTVILQPGTYTLSCVTDIEDNVYIYDSETAITSFNSRSHITFTANNEMSLRIRFFGASSISNIMLVKGSEALPYKEYNGAILHRVDVPDYSFQEVNTHQKWIDGKDVYRMVFYISSIGNQAIQVSDKVTDAVIKMYGTFCLDSSFNQVREINSGNDISMYQNGGDIRVYNSSSSTRYKVYAIIEYTK